MNLYSIAGVQLAPGADLTTTTQRIDTALESAEFDAPIGAFAAVEVQHRYGDLDSYDDNQLARWGIVRTVVADPLPPVVRPELPKSTVIARLNTIGKLTPVWTVLQSNPLAFSQWFAPDWPNVYCDDAGMLAILGAAGLSSSEIATVTAHG